MTADNWTMTIFVCADLHAYDSKSLVADPGSPSKGGRDKPSFYDVSGDEAQCPMRSLVKYVEDNSLKADTILCAGDLCDGASPTGLKECWDQLQTLKSKMSASAILATVGNHDMDSRLLNSSYDPREALQSLTPMFPVDDVPKSDQFWSRHYCFHENDEVRFCIINSSAYHGMAGEHKRGRISKKALKEIKAYLEDNQPKKINVLLCHHPPHSQSENFQGEGDQIHCGDDVIDLFSNGDHGDWLIVFGHKHFPNVEYARGIDSAPILLSSAALSAMPYAEYGLKATNQVHFLDFSSEDLELYGFVFKVRSYQWTPGDGWSKATYERGLPRETGIGFRIKPSLMAKKIIDLLGNENEMEWRAVTAQLPELEFVPSGSIYRILKLLERNHSVFPEFADVEYRSKILKIVKP